MNPGEGYSDYIAETSRIDAENSTAASGRDKIWVLCLAPAFASAITAVAYFIYKAANTIAHTYGVL